MKIRFAQLWITYKHGIAESLLKVDIVERNYKMTRYLNLRPHLYQMLLWKKREIILDQKGIKDYNQTFLKIIVTKLQ